MNVIDCIQGTPEWHAARAGRVTASRVAEIMARTKTGYGASRANYAAELVAERLTGTVAASFSNAAMQWGTEKEPDARAAYSLLKDFDVELVGFVVHPSIDAAGASPDGLVGKGGLVELKCPQTATQIELLLSDTVQSKYITQVQWQMATCERDWCDFVSYDPRLPGNMALFVKRIERDDAYIAELEAAVKQFLLEVDATVSALTVKFNTVEAEDE